MGTKFYAKLAALGFAVGLLCTGCGTGMTVVALMSPSISQVSPQVVTAGTANVTVTVQGTNFESQAALTVNGTAVPTTVMNSTTIAANIPAATLAQPAVAQLQVKNSNGASSNQVPLTVTAAPDGGDDLTITTTQLPSVQVGTAYKVNLAATGGVLPYKWSVSSGSLPAGLTLSSGGLISGTPTAVGTSTFSVTATDSAVKFLSKTVTYSIVVTAAQGSGSPSALSISSTPLGAGAVGSSYAAQLSANGGTPGFTWSLASGKLPAGLSLSSAGVISGTPTASGTSNFAVSVKDSGSPAQTASASESITVSSTPGKLTITTTSLGAGKSGSSYSTTLSASGGTPGYTWSLASGKLPAGLTLSSGGVISGSPTASGTSTFTVAVQDSGSPAQTASVQESITVSATSATLTVTSTSLAAAKNGSSYSTTLSATGGTPGYTWSIASGSLPAGLTLSGGGVISGTPTANGTATFTVAVTDSGSPAQTASAQESITVSTTAPALTITSTSLGAAKNGSSYSATLSANGGTPGYTWSIASGSLPAGLTLSSGGVISGTPTANGTATFTVAVKDSGSPVQTASAQESIAVSAPSATLTVTSTSLAAAKNGSSYSTTLSASGGTPGYTWSIASGSLPAGLTLSSGGVISGTPTANGTATFTVGVKDNGSPVQTASAQESITVSTTPATLTVTSTSLAAAKSGSSYSTTLSASGGTPGYTWSVSGSLPAGLTLSAAGVISGTPTATGTSTFTVTVADSASPQQTASAQESIAVSAAPSTLTITSTSLGAAQPGSTYSTTLAATGGTPSYTWSIASGSLPAGLTMSSAGVISGMPTGAGNSSFKVTVTDSASPAVSASAQESIAVSAASSTLTITTVALGNGISGSGYSATLNATGGTPGYTWSIATGSLPDGLTMSSGGVISGTPTASGSSTFTVSAADSGSPVETATQQESITVNTHSSVSSGTPQIYVYPQTPVAPRGSYQTVTAVVSGVNDKTVTWTSDGGTIVGTNPCVVNEPCTVALYTTTPGTYHLTAKSNANSSVAASSTITITGSPTPQTSHPRLGGITAAMLPALRAKAVPGNPMYESLYNNAVTDFNIVNGSWSWSCNGGSGQPNVDQTESFQEQYTYLFAFMSMIDPNDPTYNWGCYGRDMWVYYANFWLNPLSSAYSPDTLVYRQVDANYGLTGNHGADSTEQLTLTPDWLMAGGYLSASDLQVTRAYMALVGQQMINIALTGNRAPVGNYNGPGQLNTGSIWDYDGQRSMGNNYSHSKIMYLTAAALTFNDTTADDPAEPNTCGASRYVVCPDGTAGSLHAYWNYLSGGMLYKDYGHMEDPTVSLPAYQAAFSNLPSMPTCEDSRTGQQIACLGDGRGGESAEGSWYQYSMYRLALALASIQSAGYDDPILYGPQMSLGTSSWWDLKAVSDIQFLTYAYVKAQPRVAFLSTGDTLQLARAPSDFNTQAWMMVGDALNGRTDRTASLEWPLLSTTVGGLSSFYSNMANAYGAVNAIPMFVSLPAGDPTANVPSDPRTQLPTDLYSGGNQHIMVRSGWDPTLPFSASEADGGGNTTFSYYCSNTLNDHEHETCGGFDVLSQGEFITKTRTVFNDYNMMLATAEHSNEAGYGVPPIPACATAGGCFEYQAALGSDGRGGGQFWHGYQAGPATVAHAELPGYVATIVDTTQLYNASSAVGWGAMSGITAASRSLLYLRGSNQVITYDRSAGNASSRRVWLTTTGALTVNGTVASWPTRSGKQAAFVTSLLPANATLSDAGAYMTLENGNPNTSDWEPYSHLLIDGGSPASTQFLTVLEWGGSAFTKSNTVLVQSTAGQNFDGALVGGSLVMFMRNWPATFTSVTYPASGASTQFVSDLTPNTTYTISGDGAPATATTDAAGVLTFSAAGTGSITVSTGH